MTLCTQLTIATSKMTDKEHYYLFPPTQTVADFNRQMFKLGQQPENWALKGLRLKHDASLFYKINQQSRLFIIKELEDKEFNFSRFHRYELEHMIGEILNKNQDYFLPDFDTYYLLMHLSLENFFKSIWLDKHSERLGFEKLPNELNNKHDIITLAKDINLELSSDQKNLISKIRDLFLGYARYPTRLRFKKPSDSNDLDFGEKPFGTICIECLENPYERDNDIFEDIFKNQLQERLNQVFENSDIHMRSTFKFNEELTSSK
jgi:hypothetical protein